MTNEEVVKIMLSVTSECFLEWLKNETDIVNKDTREVLENVELDLKPNSKTFDSYVIPKLKEKGIEIKF